MHTLKKNTGLLQFNLFFTIFPLSWFSHTCGCYLCPFYLQLQDSCQLLSPKPRIKTWYGLNITSCVNQLGAWETRSKSSWEHYELPVGQQARPHLAVYLIPSSTFLCESVQTCSFWCMPEPYSTAGRSEWTYKEDTECVKEPKQTNKNNPTVHTHGHTLGAEQKGVRGQAWQGGTYEKYFQKHYV